MFEETYITIAAPAAGLFSDRGSKFISLAAPVRSESEVKNILQQVRSEHPKANHHCYAFRLGPSKSVYRFSDDREPSGTAGKPIYGVIQAQDLTDIIIVVSRIFGGALLGVPGLIHAYRSAAISAAGNAQIITAYIMEKYRLRFGYSVQHGIMELVKSTKARIISRQESDECMIEIELPKKDAGVLLEGIRLNHILREQCEINVL
jgi:uncharacterized YigZ family protein